MVVAGATLVEAGVGTVHVVGAAGAKLPWGRGGAALVEGAEAGAE